MSLTGCTSIKFDWDSAREARVYTRFFPFSSVFTPGGITDDKAKNAALACSASKQEHKKKTFIVFQVNLSWSTPKKYKF